MDSIDVDIKMIKGLYFNHKRKKLGEILVGLNMITAEQLDDMLIQQKYHNSFLKILPAGKVLEILKAEDKFHRDAFKQAFAPKN